MRIEEKTREGFSLQLASLTADTRVAFKKRRGGRRRFSSTGAMNWANALKKAVHEQAANAMAIAATDSSTLAMAAVEPILSGHLDYRCLVFGTR